MITLKSLYEAAKRQATPGQQFIERVSRITHRSPATVRMWLSDQQVPDSQVQEAIANEFNVPVEGLFASLRTEVKQN